MDALTLLLNRTSQPRLEAPAPDADALANIKRAALRAPDHASLTPWRFIICEGAGLNKLGALFEQSAIDTDKSAKEIERAPQLPLRAPMVIIAIAKVQESPKVPRVEQVASTACAVMAMQMAAIAQGFQGIWRTGSYAQCDTVKRGLNLTEEDEIVGFLYLGTATIEAPERKPHDLNQFFEHWS
ncbi:NAD(P)H nitroreductase [Alteromonas ponticola]|uniref:Putative NAD(P)H nitroreductase n=1 Tax=Alteromonas ponticola TaxID=2720613 RepID=A0ABX1QZK6_9ALTE|nr:NAD(P)H nitroreductase [Alteromonas ponticola]